MSVSSFDHLSDFTDEDETQEDVTPLSNTSPPIEDVTIKLNNAELNDSTELKKSQQNDFQESSHNDSVDSHSSDDSCSSETVCPVEHKILLAKVEWLEKDKNIFQLLSLSLIILSTFLYACGAFLFYTKQFEISKLNQALSNQTQIEIAREKLNKMECLEEIPESWMNKWKPDVSRWKEFDEIVRTQNFTFQEEVQYKKTRVVLKKTHNRGISLQMVLRHQKASLYDIIYHMTGPCAFYCKTQKFTAYLNTGMLHIEGDITTKNGTKTRFALVYGIDDNDLI